MASGVRERKKGAGASSEKRKAAAAASKEETKKHEQEQEQGPVDLEPDFKVVVTIMGVFFALLGLFVYYKIDGRNNGPFANWVNGNILQPMQKSLMPKNRYQKGF